MRSLITEAIAEQRSIENAAQQLNDLALRLRNQAIDRQLTALTQRAALPELGDAERLALLREQQALRQRKREPLVQRAPEPVLAQPAPRDEEEPPVSTMEQSADAHGGDVDEPF